MANLFPDEMVNVTDLRVERLGGQGDFATETGSRSVVMSGRRAIVARNNELVKGFSGQELQLVADIYIAPDAPVVQPGDRALWSDFLGAVSEEEVLEIEPWSMGGDLFGVRLRVGQRASASSAF